MQIVDQPLRVCAGVDVGGQQINVAWWVFGAAGAVWPLGGASLPFEPGQPLPCAALWQLLQCPVSLAGAVELPVSAVGVDTGGHYTNALYRFVQQHEGSAGPLLMAIKGFAARDEVETMRPRLVDTAWAGKLQPQALTLWLVNFVALQTQLTPWFTAQCPGVPLPDTAVYALAAHHWLSAYAGA